MKVLTIKELMSSTDSLEFLVDPIVPLGGSLVLGGAPGDGKSWLMLQLALDVSRGEKFLGLFPTRQGGVLLVDEENPLVLVRERLTKLALGQGIVLQNLPIYFAIWQGVKLCEPKSAEEVMKEIEKHDCILAVFDSLVRVHNRDENSATEMAKLFESIRAIMSQKVSCLIAHHNRKPGMNGGDSAHALRGSSDIRAFADSQLSIRRSGDQMLVTQEKARWTASITPFSFAIVDTPNGGVQIVAEESCATPATNPIDNFILGELSCGTKTRKQLIAAGDAHGFAERTIDSRLKHLTASGLLQKENRINGETPYRLKESMNSAESAPNRSGAQATTEVGGLAN